METLPNEILLKILQYQNAEDLARFKRISPQFENVIEDNRQFLPAPRLRVELVSGNFFAEPEKHKIQVEIQWRKLLTMHYISFDRNVVTKEISGEEGEVSHLMKTSFFQVFFGSASIIKTPLDFFKFVFSKGDVHLVINHDMPQIAREILKRAISETNCRFTKIELFARAVVTVAPKKIMEEYLFMISEKAKKYKNIPKLEYHFCPRFTGDRNVTVHKLSLLSELYPGMVVQIPLNMICLLILPIVECSNKYTEDKFNFSIEVPTTLDDRQAHPASECFFNIIAASMNIWIPESFRRRHAYSTLPEFIEVNSEEGKGLFRFNFTKGNHRRTTVTVEHIQ